jgi:hypothetical protein
MVVKHCMSASYIQLRTNYEQLLANYMQHLTNYEQLRVNFEHLCQMIVNITSHKNASSNKKEEPVKAEVGSSN